MLSKSFRTFISRKVRKLEPLEPLFSTGHIILFDLVPRTLQTLEIHKILGIGSCKNRVFGLIQSRTCDPTRRKDSKSRSCCLGSRTLGPLVNSLSIVPGINLKGYQVHFHYHSQETPIIISFYEKRSIIGKKYDVDRDRERILSLMPPSA